MTQQNAQGTEHECVVLFQRPMSYIYPEFMSRARNVLIIVTTLGDKTVLVFSLLYSLAPKEGFLISLE